MTPTTSRDPVELEPRVDGPDDAPALVLGNSLGTTLEMWDAQVPVLARHLRVIRYNPRGHGASPTPPGPYAMEGLGADLLHLLDSLDVDRFSLAGISLGGMIAMQVASAVPDRVRHLIVGPSAAYLGPASIWDERARAAREEGNGSFAEQVVGRWFTESFKHREPETVAWITRMVAENPDEGHAAAAEAIRDMDLREALRGVTAATLVMTAAQDRATPAEHTELIASNVPGAGRLIIDHASHLAAVEQPALYAAALLGFVLGVDV